MDTGRQRPVMIVTDVSAVIPFMLYKDREVEQAIIETDHIISPDLYMAEYGNGLLQYAKNEFISPNSLLSIQTPD